MPEDSQSSDRWTARALAVAMPTLSPSSLCHDALDMLVAFPDVFGLAVVRDEVPCGILSRIPFMTILARPNMLDLYGHRPVALVMDREPLVVEATMKISDLSILISKVAPNAMINGFIVTDDGRYLGVGTGLDLLSQTTEQSEQRNRELNDAMRQAMAANAAKSQFLAHMSHELRTPLNAVLGFSEMILKEMLGPIGVVKYREYAVDIHSSASHLLSLINDVLDLSKAEAGKFSLDLEATDLASLVAECLRLFAIRALEAKLILTSQLAPDLAPILADARKIKQILINLLSNAIKFTPERGEVTVELALKRPGVFLLSVSDTGIGMDEEDVALALSPFGQAKNTLTRSFPGTGLGLPLAKALVELHGGTLQIVSAPQVGTHILIELPLALAPQSLAPLALTEAERTTKSATR
jgi:two-component system, cell cycle sensor histidine kinase PleC